MAHRDSVAGQGMRGHALARMALTRWMGDAVFAAGNLVTNARWEDFWLNEGWTVFLERKIIGRIDGEQARQFHASQVTRTVAAHVQLLSTRLSPHQCISS